MQEKKGIGHELKVFGKGFFVAFSMYSKIPMPQFPWADENMKYAICFFPVIGVVIAALSYGWYVVCTGFLPVPEIARVCFAVAIPVLISGGIHVDGFMDTCDALHSYQSKERKLEILKDSHIGAFSVIMLFLFSIAGIGAYSMLTKEVQRQMMGCVFVLSRIFSGISVVTLPNAKKEGTLYAFSSHAHKNVVRGILFIEALICISTMCYINLLLGAFTTIGVLLTFLFYKRISLKEFGGITGDLAGWFLCVCELTGCIVIGFFGTLFFVK